MGNTILKDYKVSEHQTASGGIDSLWAIYDAVCNETGKNVSAFILEKAKCPPHLQTNELYNLVRWEASLLLRLKHPNVLRLLKPMQETRGEFILMTERVSYSLSNIVGYRKNLPMGSVKYVQLNRTEVKHGVRQIGKAINFCNNGAKVCHLNVSVSNIYITENGDWKLAGFNFSREFKDNSRICLGWEYPNISEKNSTFSPELKFVSPEVVFQQEATSRSDAYSFGMVILVVSQFQYTSEGNIDIQTFEEYRNYLRRLTENSTFEPVFKSREIESVKRLLLNNELERGSISDFLVSDFFIGAELDALKNLDSFFELDKAQKIDFLLSLPSVLNDFEYLTIREKFVPTLLMQAQDEEMCDKALAPVFFLLNQFKDKKIFNEKIAPELSKIISRKSSLNTLKLITSNLPIMFDLATEQTVSSTLIPIAIKGLENNNVKLISDTLRSISLIVKTPQTSLSFRDLKSKIFPRVRKLATIKQSVGSLLVRIDAILCITEISAILGGEDVFEGAISTCCSAAQEEPKPAVIMSTLGLFRRVCECSGRDVLCKVVLPNLMPLLAWDCLRDSEVEKIMEVIDFCISEVKKSFLCMKEKLDGEWKQYQ